MKFRIVNEIVKARKRFFVLFLFPMGCFSTPLKDRIATILKAYPLNEKNVGIYIQSFQSKEPLFALNETTPLNPASTQKIITAARALEAYGPAHAFETKVFKTPQGICMKGEGDPGLVHEELFRLSEEMRAQNFTKIDQITVDDTAFPAHIPYGEAFEGDGHRAFVSPVGALSINFNAITAMAKPQTVGAPAHIFLEPFLERFKVVNHTRTVPMAQKSDARVEVKQNNAQWQVVISGQVGQNKPTTLLYASFPEPAQYVGEVMAEFLTRQGVAGEKKVLKGVCSGSPVATLKGKPLSEVVWGMNKFSNNFIAEMLAFATEHHDPVLKVESWIEKIDPSLGSQMTLHNFSGLSRKNRISAKLLNRILQFASQHPTYGPEFLSSLSIGGEDGTLKNRFSNQTLAAQVRAKSGSLSNVTALAGVLMGKNENIGFVFLWNDQRLNGAELRTLEEKILGEVLQHPI